MTLIPDSLWIDSPPSTEKAVSVYRGLNINKQPSYIRAIKVSFKALTTYKKKRIHGMIRAYRQTVNAYIRHFYSHCLNLKGSPFKLDSATLALLPKGYMGLTERYKSQALKQALQILKSVDSSKKEQKAQHLTGQRQASCPVFKGYPALSSKTVAIMPAETMRQ